MDRCESEERQLKKKYEIHGEESCSKQKKHKQEEGKCLHVSVTKLLSAADTRSAVSAETTSFICEENSLHACCFSLPFKPQNLNKCGALTAGEGKMR